MDRLDYLADPCGASSLPFWKTERVTPPAGVLVLRDDAFAALRPAGRDEPYFKLMHPMKALREPLLPDGFRLVSRGAEAFAAHISACYERERVSAEELLAYRTRPTFRPALWLAVAEAESGRLAASGIAELDARLGEGILEWVQVSPEQRRRGLGAFVVCELLRRMRGEARFVTVSGRLDSESRPLALYQSCGFENPVLWHVVTR